MRSMLKWPGFLDRLMKVALPPSLEFYKYDGSLIVKLSDRDAGGEGIVSAPLWRNSLHAELYRYAMELSIPITFDKSVVEFWEIESKGFIRCSDGQQYEADVVVAADGITSKAAKLIVKEQETPTSSEYAIYRTSFPLGEPTLEMTHILMTEISVQIMLLRILTWKHSGEIRVSKVFASS